jgi:hypothetical protein
MSGLPKQNLDVLKRVEAEGNQKDDDPDNQVRREDEDGTNLSIDEGEGKPANPEDFVNENMTFTKWNALKAFAESLQQTATLYELQGSVYYAEYYYLKVDHMHIDLCTSLTILLGHVLGFNSQCAATKGIVLITPC